MKKLIEYANKENPLFKKGAIGELYDIKFDFYTDLKCHPGLVIVDEDEVLKDSNFKNYWQQFKFYIANNLYANFAKRDPNTKVLTVNLSGYVKHNKEKLERVFNEKYDQKLFVKNMFDLMNGETMKGVEIPKQIYDKFNKEFSVKEEFERRIIKPDKVKNGEFER